ncbi:MAG: hypothetical protein LV471_08405 [Nitrosomonas sp.]|nr:hypothetical protein [Nitrosomonas sp.]
MRGFADLFSILPLESNDIHIWISRANRIRQTDLLRRYQDLLTEDERLKQIAYLCPKKRHYTLITRVFVRDLLSRYVNMSPILGDLGRIHMASRK